MNADNLDHGKVDGDQPQSGGEPTAVEGSERGGILEGLFDKPSQEGAEQESGLDGLLKVILAQGGDLGDLLQTFLGTGISQMLPSAVSRLASNLDLSSETAQAIVAFVLGKLSTAQADKAAGERLDLSGLLEQVGGDQADEASALRTTGWAEELAAKTGLDVGTALEAIQTLFLLLSGQEIAAAKKKRKSTKKKATTKPKPTSTKKKTTSSKPKTTSTKKKTTTKPKPTTTKKKTTSSKPKAASTKKKTTTKPKSKTTSTKKKTTVKTKPKATSTKKKATTGSKPKTTSSKKKTTVKSKPKGTSKKPSS
jgi:outer membrane biosynthesis protein TonB